MPRFIRPKKDAKPAKVVEELAKSYDPAVSEWGNPLHLWWRTAPYGAEVSRGTEISKYPEEKKS